MSKEVFVRLGFSDVVVTKKENDNLNGNIDLIDEEGNIIASTNAYFIGYEDEYGNECDEYGDGNLYNEDENE